MHVRTGPALWKRLQSDDAVPTKSENAFQKNWVLAVNIRIDLPAAQSRGCAVAS
jgi:hypothetical protein